MSKIKGSVIVGLLGGMLATHGALFLHNWSLARRGYSDFTVFYTAGTIVRLGLGHGLYDPALQYRVQQGFASGVRTRNVALPYMHPPFEALLFVPLTLFDFSTAYAVWDILNLFALAVLFLLLRSHIPLLQRIPFALWLAVCLAFFPVFGCFLQGQDSILLLLLCTLGFRALQKNMDFLAGCWFALGTFKFQFMVPLVLLLMFWKRRRVGAGFAVVAFLLALLSLALVGWNGLVEYPALVFQVVRSPGLGRVLPELMPNLRGLVEGWPLNIPAAALSCIVIAASVGLLAFAGWKTRSAVPRHFNVQFSLAVVVAVLIAWHTNGHDLSLLVLPLLLLADYCRSFLADAPHGKRALLIPVLPILLSPLWLLLWLGVGRVNVMAIPLLWWAWAIGRKISRVDSSAPMPTGKQPGLLC